MQKSTIKTKFLHTGVTLSLLSGLPHRGYARFWSDHESIQIWMFDTYFHNQVQFFYWILRPFRIVTPLPWSYIKYINKIEVNIFATFRTHWLFGKMFDYSIKSCCFSLEHNLYIFFIFIVCLLSYKPENIYVLYQYSWIRICSDLNPVNSGYYITYICTW